jgi:chromosome segregation ATPase
MKTATAVALVAVPSVAASPIAKIIEMIGDLEAKIIGEGEAVQKTYAEFAEWCETESRNVQYEIKTGKAEVEDLDATIDKEASNIVAQTATIEELAGGIATDEADLKAATEIRNKEQAVFSEEEKDLVETIDTLERAVGIVEKEMNGGASMLQASGSVVQALATMVKAQSLSSAEGARLTALVQDKQESDDDDSGAPQAAAYSNQSGGIVDTLNDLLEKAQAQLDTARTKEEADIQNFEMLQQSLTDEIKFANKEMDSAKKSKSESEEGKATAEGDLSVTTKDLDEDLKTLGGLHHDCMTKANDFEAETKSRAEELKALATAKKIIKENVAGAAASFLQDGITISTHADLVNFEAVRFVRDLAKKQHSTALSQLASRMVSVVRFATGDKADVFAKIKGLITDMISKLESDAEKDATQKAWCDKELAETNQKKDTKTAEVAKLTAKIDSDSSKSKQLKSQVAELQAQLGELTRSQAEMDKVRAEEKALYQANKAEMEQGLSGIKQALKVLNDYYAKDDKAHSGGGDSSGIIGLLEVCESDFSKELAEMTESEETSQATYDRESKENEISKVMKEQDVKYKTKDAAGLDKNVAELTSDRAGTEEELAAAKEYLAQLEGQCIAKAETYGERKARREAEIAGLKEAQQVLENETAFIQKGIRTLRGARKHVA